LVSLPVSVKPPSPVSFPWVSAVPAVSLDKSRRALAKSALSSSVGYWSAGLPSPILAALSNRAPAACFA
jgi:hypothetical protein